MVSSIEMTRTSVLTVECPRLVDSGRSFSHTSSLRPGSPKLRLATREPQAGGLPLVEATPRRRHATAGAGRLVSVAARRLRLPRLGACRSPWAGCGDRLRQEPRCRGGVRFEEREK